jgi:hypothetical protein
MVEGQLMDSEWIVMSIWVVMVAGELAIYLLLMI